MKYIGLVTLRKEFIPNQRLYEEFKNWSTVSIKKLSKFKDCFIYWIPMNGIILSDEDINKQLNEAKFVQEYFQFWVIEYSASLESLEDFKVIFGKFRTVDVP